MAPCCSGEACVTQECASAVGVVVIGRNEGDRLKRCLRSVVGLVRQVVYVDSGSTDGSVEFARSLGVEVVELDMSKPFTMARGRNAGLERLVQCCPEMSYVQFVDGDCEMADGWMARAREFLDQHPQFAVVCGRRRERYPDVSIYNRLCDMEWATPIGEVKACGGDAMMRISVLQEVGGYNPDMIAGEEPELCVRIRQAGWRIMRLDGEMTLHDAAMTRFGQWWRRAVRAGHAYAEGAAVHGRGPERHGVKAIRSFVFWGAVVPLLALGGAWTTSGASLTILLGYPLLWYRVARLQRALGHPRADAHLYAAFILISKFAELYGALVFLWRRLLRRRPTLIEYKDPGSSVACHARPSQEERMR